MSPLLKVLLLVQISWLMQSWHISCGQHEVSSTFNLLQNLTLGKNLRNLTKPLTISPGPKRCEKSECTTGKLCYTFCCYYYVNTFNAVFNQIPIYMLPSILGRKPSFKRGFGTKLSTKIMTCWKLPAYYYISKKVFM